MQICRRCVERYGGVPAGFELAENCDICNNIFDKVENIVELFLNETKELEFSTFLIGCTFPEEIIRKDEFIIESEFNKGKKLKHFFNSIIGKEIEEKTGKTAEFKNPEVVFRFNAMDYSSDIDIKPIYLAGRYLKLKRGIPQSPWIFTGHSETMSVSEYIGIPITKYFHGRDYNFFASGREDVDVLMLGNGRPFYVEVVHPRRRSADLEVTSETVKEKSAGAVIIEGLHIATQEEILSMKNETHDKVYEVSVNIEGDHRNFVETVEGIKDLEILQRTPERVLRSRADMVRRKKIYGINVTYFNPPRAILKIRASSGTYVKEFIHGDKGRTTPSLSSILGVNIKIEYLNVLEIN